MTHTAELNKVFTVINPFRSKMKVHLKFTLLRLILNVILVIILVLFLTPFLILARAPFSNKEAHKTIILIATDTH